MSEEMPQPKSYFGRILAYNLLVLLGIAGMLRLLIQQESRFAISGYGVLMALVIGVLFLLNLGRALLAGSGRRAAWLLAALLVLLIGFGVCAVGVRSIPRTEEIP